MFICSIIALPSYICLFSSIWYKLICITRWFEIKLVKHCLNATFIAWTYQVIIMIPINMFQLEILQRNSILILSLSGGVYAIIIRILLTLLNVSLLYVFLKVLKKEHEENVDTKHLENKGQRPIKWKIQYKKSNKKYYCSCLKSIITID